MREWSDTVYWISGDGSVRAEELAARLELPDFRFVACGPHDMEWHLDRLGVDRAAAIVLDSSVEHPLRVARLAYRSAPLSQIVFIADGDRLHALRSQLSLAPMIGTYWTIVGSDPARVADTLVRASRVNRQRRHLRTTLDRINLRLRSERPPQDSAEYRKLVVSDRYLAAILEHAQDAIISLDGRGRVATWNRGATRLFGIAADRAGSLRLEDLFEEDEEARPTRWFASALKGSPVIQVEARCRRHPDESFSAEVTLAPVRDDAGDVIAVALTAHDITERKRTENELRSIHSELESRVASRTQELRRAYDELEAFTYSASHDLRAPLRGIDGFSQALLEDFSSDLSGEAQGYVKRIRDAASRMGEIIDALLLLSRITQSQIDSDERVDLTTVCRQIAAELSEREPERKVEFDIESGMTVEADPKLLRVAMENLLGNAWKFTREREVARIEVGRVADAAVATFFVRDNGAGFDMEFAGKLFLPFQRLHDPRRFPGTGIGLGTVERIISKHGGRVWAQSAPEAGATFYLELPGRDGSSDEDDAGDRLLARRSRD